MPTDGSMRHPTPLPAKVWWWRGLHTEKHLSAFDGQFLEPSTIEQIMVADLKCP